jgi:hypothetical protein
MFKISMVAFILLIITGLSASEKIPVPQESAPYSEKFVREDEAGGDQIICNQLVVVFTEDVTRTEQQMLLQKINGEIVGGVPEMDIYQIRIPNPDASISKVKMISSEITKHKHVAHAGPRKVPTGMINKIDIKRTKPVKRMGTLDMAPAERAAPEEEDAMVSKLTEHKKNLHSCLKSASTHHGFIEYRITINPAGQVTGIKVLKSNFRDKNLKDCLAFKMRKWDDFPLYTKNYDRQLEFTFKF